MPFCLQSSFIKSIEKLHQNCFIFTRKGSIFIITYISLHPSHRPIIPKTINTTTITTTAISNSSSKKPEMNCSMSTCRQSVPARRMPARLRWLPVRDYFTPISTAAIGLFSKPRIWNQLPIGFPLQQSGCQRQFQSAKSKKSSWMVAA